MTQSDFIKAVAADVNSKYSAENKKTLTVETVKDVVNSFTNVTTDLVAKGEKISLSGFGSFDVSVRAARDGINPQTKQPIHIDEKKSVKFKAAKAFKDILNA